MAPASEFEDLIAWRKARELFKVVDNVSRTGGLARDFPLRDQMRRAALSIMANVAEGFDRSRPREFHQFLSTAKASSAELRSHLYAALDAGYLTPAAFERLIAQTREVGRVITRLRKAVQRRLPST